MRRAVAGLVIAIALLLAAAAGWVALRWAAAAFAVGAVAVAVAAAYARARQGALLRGLANGLLSFAERDYAVRLAPPKARRWREAVERFNALGAMLRGEAARQYERQLLLEAVVDGAPMAILLADASGRIVQDNPEARALVGAGRTLVGRTLEEVLAAMPPPARAAFQGAGDALFTVPGDGETDSYLLARRTVTLETRKHELYTVRRLTRELRRQEVEVWKKVIRVMGHELNNSLAPVLSLLGSARLASRSPAHVGRIEGMLDTVEDRVRHLQMFLDGYARFARLPRPNCAAVEWAAFLADVTALFPVRVAGVLPEEPGFFDAGQIQQVLINLLKNAAEAGSPAEATELRVEGATQLGFRVTVADRGHGISPETLSQALVPFYSTKRGGSGLGLTLAREIVEAHGGQLRLEPRDGGGVRASFWLPARAKR